MAGILPAPRRFTHNPTVHQAVALIRGGIANPDSRRIRFLDSGERTRPTFNIGLRYDVERVSNVDGHDAPPTRTTSSPPQRRRIPSTCTTVIRGGVGLTATAFALLHQQGPTRRAGRRSDAVSRAWPPSMPVFPSTLPRLFLSSATRHPAGERSVQKPIFAAGRGRRRASAVRFSGASTICISAGAI